MERRTHRAEARSSRTWLTAVLGLLAAGSAAATQGGDRPAPVSTTAGSAVDEARLSLGKLYETEQILSRERKDWQQGKDILLGRLEVVRQEKATLEEKIEQGKAAAAEVEAKKAALVAEKDALVAVGTQLTEAVTRLEGDVRRLFRALPEPTQQKLQPLFLRIPEDAATTRVAVAERYQNVLGILNELNKANNELTVGFEVHKLSNGKPSEVQVLYVGLAQAYFLSGGGDAGIGRPSSEGWQWEGSPAAAGEIRKAIEIQQSKQSPAFVPLPVRLQ